MTWQFRYRDRLFLLEEGQCTIGRSEDCTICLDDPLASRRHAQVTLTKDDPPVILDLSSRNGTFVNGKPISGAVTLAAGDTVRVGTQDIAVSFLAASKLDTLTDLPGARSLEALKLLGQLAEKALTMGNAVEAERIVSRYLEEQLEGARQGHLLSDERFELVASLAHRLAQGTRRSYWLDFLFTIHELHGKIMEAEMVHSLYEMSRHVSGSSRPQLVSYINSLRDPTAPRTPSEKFVLGRLDGLTKLMS